MVTFSNFISESKPESSIVPISKDYRVFVGGVEIPVYGCRISAYPFNVWWQGHQRPFHQSEEASYVNLVCDGEVTLEVEPLTKKAYERVMLKPYSKGVQATEKAGKICFTLTENGGYVLELDDYHHLLYIFNNKPVPCENREDVTYYFGPGVHLTGKISLKSGESIYLDKDALVYGCVYAENAENIRVYGNGVFDDSAEARICGKECYEYYTNGNAKFYDCKHIRIEGVGFVNSAVWCINLFHCTDVLLDGMNVFGQWRYNSDGIDAVNSKRVTIRNCFIHSFDDTVVIKGIDRYAYEDNEDILTEHCVLWCDWGKTLEIGFEANCLAYKNIVFRDCDVLRGGNTVCDIQNGDCAEVSDVIFEDIRVEYESFYTPYELQKSEDAVYTGQGKIEVPLFLHVSNAPFRAAYNDLEGKGWIPYAREKGDPAYASVHDILVKNLQIICDPEIMRRLPQQKIARLRIVNQIDSTFYGRMTVENLTLNGVRVPREDMEMSFEGNVGTLNVI